MDADKGDKGDTGSFDKRLLHQLNRREKAAKKLQDSLSSVGGSAKAEVKRLTGGTTIEEIIIAHPFISAGVALGAGVLASKIITSTASAKTSGGEPQRVVIEVKHGDQTVAAPAAAAHSFNIVELVSKAMAGYQAIQGVLRNMAAGAPPDVSADDDLDGMPDKSPVAH